MIAGNCGSAVRGNIALEIASERAGAGMTTCYGDFSRCIGFGVRVLEMMAEVIGSVSVVGFGIGVLIVV